MPTWTFTKKSGAPAGQINIAVGNDEFTINDTTTTSIVTTNPFTAGELSNSPYLIQSGLSGTVPPSPLIEQLVLVNGVLSKPGPAGTYTTVTGVGGSAPATVTGAPATSVAAAVSLPMASGVEAWLTGTLTQNVTVTVTPLAGASARMQLAQDGTGSRTVTLSDGLGHTQVLSIPTAAGSVFEVFVDSPDGTILYYSVLGTPAVATVPAGAPSYAVLTADIAGIVSQTTLQNTGLGVPLSASPTEIWKARWGFIYTAADTTMDLKLGLSLPGTTQAYHGAVGANGAVGWQAVVQTSSPLTLGDNTSSPAYGTVALVTRPAGLIYEAVIIGTGTAGTVQLQYAQNTSSTGALVVKAGSYVEYVKLHA